MSQQVPPLRQSVHTLLACEHAYNLVHIQGLKPMDTIESERGTQVHEVLAPYAVHCSEKRVPADYLYLDSLLDRVGEQAAEVLQVCRENLEIDWENFWAAEIPMGLDKHFKPTHSYDHKSNRIELWEGWGIESSGEEPAYCLIADQLLIMPSETEGGVIDYKTHPRQFPADTFQGKLYVLAYFMHMPKLRQVVFTLKFVRYANVFTQAVYLRSDVPAMMEAVKRVRGHQLEIHEKVQQGMPLAVHGGSHCQYCPASKGDPAECPMLATNPALLSAPQRLSWRLAFDVWNRNNNQAMQQWVDGTGESIHTMDANGNNYTFGPESKKKTLYPLFAPNESGGFDMPIVDALVDWAQGNPSDLVPKRRTEKPWFTQLRIGGTELSRYLKAKKREVVHNAIRDLATVTEKIELRLSRDAEIDDGLGEEHRQFDAESGETVTERE